jgi:hypothetical protein
MPRLAQKCFVAHHGANCLGRFGKRTKTAALISTDVMLGIYRKVCQNAVKICEPQGLRRMPPHMQPAFLTTF